MSLDLTVIVLTFNEEKHIARCIGSVQGIALRVVVVDSFSTDGTVRLAQELGADVIRNPWINHATQINWALDHANIATQWVMRLDADEVVTHELAAALPKLLPSLPNRVSGITVNRRMFFLGKWIKHGGIYPAHVLRFIRTGRGRCENRWMDEVIVVDGDVVHVSADIADINLNNLTWWINKHNHYASREAIDLLLLRTTPARSWTQSGMNRQARAKRWIKERIYSRLPLGWRAALLFLTRYFLLLGFLDGWRGLVFHSMQCFWYRLLVDAKICELETAIKEQRIGLAEAVKREYGLDI